MALCLFSPSQLFRAQYVNVSACIRYGKSYQNPDLVDATVELPWFFYIHRVIYQVVMKNNPPDPVSLSWRLWHDFLEVPVPPQHLLMQNLMWP